MNEKRQRKISASLLKARLSKIVMSDPLFIFYCPVKKKRASFADKYFSYYINQWNENGELIIGRSGCLAATLINPDDFSYKFWGKHGIALRLSRSKRNIILHREVVQNVTNVILPESINKKVLSLYADSDNGSGISELIDECIRRANDENFVLVYETLSEKLIPLFESKGFGVAFTKQFMNTPFLQTLMTYTPTK